MVGSLNRLEYVDVMRGIAITLVVVGHLIQFNGVPTDNPAFEFIYSFHMPLFFIVSGYITQRVTHIDSWAKLKRYYVKKLLAIAVPFLVWSFVVNNYLLAEHWHMISLHEIEYVFMRPGLWFLKTLFLILLAYGIGNFLYYKLVCKHHQVFSCIGSTLAVFLLIVGMVICEVDGISLIMFATCFMGG